jgi:hypothetical protein
MTGVSIASSAIGVIGMATGSKTLQKIGMFGGMVGGLGQGASALARGGMGAATSAASAASKPASAMSFAESAFPAGMEAISKAASKEGITKTANSILNGSTSGGLIKDVASTGSTDIRQRMNELLGKYDTTANVLAGMGMGYVQHEENKLAKERIGVEKDALQLQRDKFTTEQANRANVPLISSLGQGIKKADGSPLLLAR